MRIRTRIRAIARERGMTAAWVARKLGLYRSNLSAMDAGKRTVSLRKLAEIARVLSCSLSDLIEMDWQDKTLPFRNKEWVRRIEEREQSLPDGTERGWVHHVLLAWQRHYRAPRIRR